MKITFLKAFNGDSIWISFSENEISRNIIIDGGIGDTYKNKSRRAGELYETIKYIRENNQIIDLLILTHFDDDHIGGLLRWFNQDKDAGKLVENIWFNSGKEISKHFGLKANEDLTIKVIEPDENFFTSTKQGIDFEEYLLKNGILANKIIKQGDTIEEFGLKFKILSPNEEKLKELVNLYKKEEYYFTSDEEFDFKTALQEFIEEEGKSTFKFKEDKSIPNGSSIAFIMEYKSNRFLFLGDAHPCVVIEGLKKFNFDKDNHLEVMLMKVAHHGSKYNTSSELLSIVSTNDFLISSSGTKHGLPNKRTIARIIKNNPKANIHFNYENLIDKIFTNDDVSAFKDFNKSYKTEFDY